MAKPNIITRATKGSALSWTEGDANLENLRDATIGISDGTTSGTLDLNDTLTFTAGTNVTVAYDINSKSLTINSTATGGLQSVNQDLAPVLGGTLNVNGNYITGNLDENVRILPSGVGRVNLSGLLYPSVDGSAGQVLTTDGAGNISWSNAGGGLTSIIQDTAPTLGGTLNVNNNQITNNPYADLQITAGMGGLVSLSADGGVRIQSIYYPGPSGASQGQYLAFDGSNSLVWTSPSSGGGLTSISQDNAPALGGILDVGPYSITSTTGGISLNPAYGSPVTINGMQWPTVDGTSGQALTTNGYGNLSWTTIAGGSLNQDYNPQLVADLDVQYSAITTSVLNGNISIRINGTGQLVIGSYNTDAIITTNGPSDLKLSTNNDTNSGYILIADGYDSDMYLAPSGNGRLWMKGMYWPSTDGTADQVLKTDGAGNLSWATAGGIADVVSDTTPQLGGDLDVNDKKIIAGTSGIVEIDSDDIRLTLAHDSLKFDEINLGDTENPFYASRISNIGTNALYFSGGIVGFGSTMATILNSDGSIDLRSTNMKFGMPGETGVTQVITTPNVGDTLVLNTGAGTDSGSINVIGGVNGNIEIQPNGTGKIKLDTHLWPNTDGIASQVLTTDGLGNLSWTTFTPGIADVVQDVTPQLGGDLDVNGKSIVSVSNGNIAITPNGTGKTVIKNINYSETPYTLTYGATITPNVTNGNVQIVTLTGNVTFSAFSNPIAGQSLTLIVKQDATGSRTLTSTMKFAGGTKTLSTAANSVDIITVFYDGTNYWASLGKDFK